MRAKVREGEKDGKNLTVVILRTANSLRNSNDEVHRDKGQALTLWVEVVIFDACPVTTKCL
jgi:hypothetical protein